MLAPIGPGSATGVAVYRHRRMPDDYRGALFAAESSFGRVWAVRLEPDGAGYRARPEVIIEAVATNRFVPTDLEVAPDGSLLISTSRRGTAGGVLRFEWSPPPAMRLW